MGRDEVLDKVRRDVADAGEPVDWRPGFERARQIRERLRNAEARAEAAEQKLTAIAALCRDNPHTLTAGDVLRIISSEEAAESPTRVVVDLNVRVRKHETYSGFDDVIGADPEGLRWGDRIVAVEVESSIAANAVVTGIDMERRIIYLAPDWHGWAEDA